MELKKLVVGRDYIFSHKRKGVFRATFKGFAVGDVVDRELWQCMIDTSKEGSPRLARTKNTSATLTNIRPSLVIDVADTPAYVPPPNQTESVPKIEERNIAKKFFNFIRN
jgi:hypothetical protein